VCSPARLGAERDPRPAAHLSPHFWPPRPIYRQSARSAGRWPDRGFEFVTPLPPPPPSAVLSAPALSRGSAYAFDLNPFDRERRSDRAGRAAGDHPGIGPDSGDPQRPRFDGWSGSTGSKTICARRTAHRGAREPERSCCRHQALPEDVEFRLAAPPRRGRSADRRRPAPLSGDHGAAVSICPWRQNRHKRATPSIPTRFPNAAARRVRSFDAASAPLSAAGRARHFRHQAARLASAAGRAAGRRCRPAAAAGPAPPAINGGGSISPTRAPSQFGPRLSLSQRDYAKRKSS